MSGDTDPRSFEGHDLEALDAAVAAAIAAGTCAGLPITGYGELSIVLAWPPDQPRWAVKTAAAMPEAAAVERLGALIDRYREALAAEGVRSAETRAVTARSGRGYLVQRLYPRDRIADDVLRNASADQRDGMLLAVIDAIDAAVSPRLGVDPHIANWAIDDDGTPVLIDVGTPMMRTADGRDEVDLSVVVAAAPAFLRPGVRMLARSLLDPYYNLHGSFADLGFNLQKAGLAATRPAFVRLANQRLAAAGAEPLVEKRLASAYRRDARVWIFLQGVRRVDRTWQRRVRRRSYGWLLPPKIDRHLR